MGAVVNPFTGKIDFTGVSPDLSGYVPYTGATADVNLGTNSLITHAVKADASDGLLLESSSGTDVGILGAANTANVTWYGSHNFEAQQADSVPYFGSSKTLSSIVKSYYNSTSNITDWWVTESSEIVLNGSFASGASWTAASGWVITGGKAQHTSNGTGNLSQTNLVVNGLRYRLTYEVLDVTVGSVTVSCGGNTFTARSSNGTYTEYFVATNNAALSFTPTNTARLSIDNVSIKQLTGSELRTGSVCSNNMFVSTTASNSSPGTTRHISLKNAGSHTYIDAYFGNSLLGAIGWNSSGIARYYAQSSNHYFYGGTLTSPQLYNYMSSTGMYSYGIVGGNNGVSAGSTGTTIPSKMTVWGGTGLKTKFVSTSQTLDDTATEIYARPDLASTCSGTPTYACSHWTNQTDCELRISHGGCTWNAITCSDYSYTDEGTCEANAGCTFTEASCGGAGDESSCLAQDDSFGGNCTWDISYGDCSSFNDDYSTCTGTYGCYWSAGEDCATYDFTDQGTCEAVTGCTWNAGNSECQGTCSGSYESGYSCNGNYFTGECSGSGGTCSGTSNCGNITNSTDCGNEGGCSWTTGLTLTMPSHATFGANFYRTYWIYNAASATALTISPNTDQTVNNTTSLSIPAGDSKKLTFFYFQEACSQWNGTSQSVCETNHTGCTWIVCSGYGSEEDCNNAGCSWDSMGGTCSGDYCSGTWTVHRGWLVTADFT